MSINIDPTRVVIRDLRHISAQAVFMNDRLIELEASIRTLIAEVERLRGENAVLIQTSADHCLACGWRFFVPGDGCQGCLVEQLRKDTKRYVTEERMADAIERGEHCREEER